MTYKEILKNKRISSKEYMITLFKGEYNYWLLRKTKAEVFFNSNSLEMCEKHKLLFNEVLMKLDIAKESLESLLGRKLTKEESKGFKLID